MSALEILGLSHDGDALCFASDGQQTRAAFPQLAAARRQVARNATGVVTVGGARLDESGITTLVAAMTAAVAAGGPPYPPTECRFGHGVQAEVVVQGKPYCRDHEPMYARTVDRQLQTARWSS